LVFRPGGTFGHQLLAIDFSIRRARKVLPEMERRGHHVARQSVLSKKLAVPLLVEVEVLARAITEGRQLGIARSVAFA